MKLLRLLAALESMRPSAKPVPHALRFDELAESSLHFLPGAQPHAHRICAMHAQRAPTKIRRQKTKKPSSRHDGALTKAS
jgi:hypothetical protein